MRVRRRPARAWWGFVVAVILAGAVVPVGPAAAAATSIAFTAEPEDEALGGTPFAIQPVVHVEDGGGPLAGQDVTLSVKSGTGEPTAFFTCSGGRTRATDAKGDADFSGCRIDREAEGYVLRATTGSISADSTPFDVIAGPAVRMFFAAYPGLATSTRLTPAPVVGVVDAGGNPAFYFPAITLEISKHSSTFSCTGGLEQRATTGFAEFKGCEQTRIEPGYRLTADDGPGGLAPVTGRLFDITNAAPTKVLLCWGTGPTCNATPPATATGGTSLPVQPVVRVTDPDGNVALLDNSTVVTLAIAPGTPTAGGQGGLTCSGGLSLTARSGYANFNGCRVRDVGTGYRLRASAVGLAAAISNPFAVAAGPPVRIGFVNAPAEVTVNEPFGASVAIQDAGGNTVTTGVSARIRLALGNNPGATGFACAANEVATIGGLATFTGCRLNLRAGGYTVTARAVDVVPLAVFPAIESAPFRAVDAAAAITLTASRSAIAWGESVILTLAIASRGAGRTVRLESSPDQRTWTTVASGTTDAAGRATIPLRPDRNRYYRVAFAGATDLGAGTSNVTRVVVRQIALLRPTHKGRLAQIESGELLAFTTTVRPARVDLPRATVRYVVYRLSGNAWRLAVSRDVLTDANGLATVEILLGVGRWYVRSQALPTAANANSAWSPPEWYEVLPLAAD